MIVLRRGRARETVEIRGDVERLTGWDAATFAGRIYSIVHPEDQRVLFGLSRRMRSGHQRVETYELRVVGPDGTYRGFRCTTESRLHDPAHADIVTELRPTGARAELNERHTGLLAAADDLVLIQDRNRHTEYVGPSVERLLGYTADRLVERWMEIVHPDDIQIFQEARDAVADAPGASTRVRLRGWHANGRLRTFDMAIVNRFDDGIIDGLLLSGRDVTDQVEAQQRLDQAEARFEALVDNNPDVALLLDGDGVIEFCSAAVESELGYDRDDVVGRNVLDFVHPDDRAIAVRELALLGTDEDSPDQVVRVRRQDGTWAWIEAKGADRTAVPALGAMVLTLREVSERVDAEQRMRRLTEVLEGTTDMVCIFDSDFDLIWANTSAITVLGSEPRGFADQAPPWARDVIEREVLGALRADGSWRGELAMVAHDGSEIPTEATVLTHRGAGGQIEFISAISRDMTERKALEAQLSEKARRDPLTGLANRARLQEHLEDLVAQDRRFAVAFLDLDQFKTVNDTQGHDVGDQLLVTFGARLRTALRPGDHVARFGGDEFVLVLVDVESAERAVELVGRVLHSVRGNMRIAGTETFITASAGVAVHDDLRLPADPATLISDADAAMYEAKARGRDQVVRFSREYRTRTELRHETALHLRRAIEDREIDVWFQPIIDTVSGVTWSVEALARWDHPDLGMVPPATFVAIAEETGLIADLGALLFDRACEHVRSLGGGTDGRSFSVNLSPRQLLDPSLPAMLAATLARHGLSGRQLVCEVTESAVMQDVTAAARMLDEIRLLGCTIAVDDFGTGYSSLAYLHRFPVDVLKVDREFIAGLSFGIEWDRSLVAGIVSLGHSLGMRVVAEGVETLEQADILAMLRCDAVQGYLFARPVPATDLPGVLADLERRSVEGAVEAERP